jgi:hypothetical protein
MELKTVHVEGKQAQVPPAPSLSIDAASQADITRVEIGKAIAKLLKSGGKITQDADSWCEAIAGLADVSQGWVSKFFTGLGGWRVWRQIITSLLKSSYRTSNNLDSALESLSEDERWIAQECLSELVAAFEKDPRGVAEAVAATALEFGGEAWARILAAADRVVVAKLLGCVAIVCPGWVCEGVAGVI